MTENAKRDILRTTGSFGFPPEFLSEAVARHRAARCPRCGQPGVVAGDAVITYPKGVALVSVNARLYRCPDCGIQFAVSTKEAINPATGVIEYRPVAQIVVKEDDGEPN